MPKKVSYDQARAQKLLSFVKQGMERYPEAAELMQPALAFAEGLVECQGDDAADEQRINWTAVGERVKRLDGRIERTGTRISDAVRIQAEEVIIRFREGERTRELAEAIAEIAL